ncbi:MAG: TRAP transporter small permease subunit [Rhodobacteraceae bacterium]|nr:TRAP transporter small permease subunit [Paracoccaceae bacterium]
MNRLNQASAAVDRACLLVAKLALGGMFLTVLLQIWARYGFDYPFSWTEELARYLMVWAGLLGATCAFRRRLDPTITTLPANARQWQQRIGLTMLFLTVVIFLVPILYHSFFGPGLNVERGFLWRSSNRISPGLGLNMALVGSIVPLSAAIILLHLMARILARDNRL